MLLNPHAETLRLQRTVADDSLAAAISSGVPYAIAAAKVAQTAVILAQIAFHARQLALLADAARLRSEGQRELRLRAGHLAARGIETPVFYSRALAVEPRPVTSLSPNYEPITMFRLGQQTRFRFHVDLLSEFPALRAGMNTTQKTECAVTLQERSDHWQIQILAAKAP